MYNDYSIPVRSPRRRVWQRDAGVMLLALVFVLAAVLLMTGAAYGSGSARSTTVRIQPGQTLWSIAEERYPRADVRQRVLDIENANGLSSPALFAGQELHLPAG